MDDHDYLFRGLPITVEKWKGERRHNRILQADYGFIPDTTGRGDGEAVDVYVGDDHHSPHAYVVEQLKEDGSFDEYKVMLGFESLPEAEAVYLAQFDPGWRETRVQAIHEVPVEEFLDVAEDNMDEDPKTAASHREWWPYGRHKFVPQEGSPECKACELPADHLLHTTPPPEKTAANPAPWAENLEGDTPMSEPRLDTIWVWHPDMGVHTSEGTDHTNLLQSIGWGAYGIAYDKIYRGYAAVYPDQKMVKVYRASSSSDEIPEDVWKEYKSLYPGFKVLTQDTGFDPKMGALHLEAEANYDEMFAGLNSTIQNALPPVDGKSGVAISLHQDIQDEINWAKATLRKNYRIIWYLRWAKLDLIEQGVNKTYTYFGREKDIDPATLNEKAHNLGQQLNSLLNKEIGRFNAGAQKAGRHAINTTDLGGVMRAYGVHNQLKHFFDMKQVDKIQDYPLDFQTIPEVLDTFQTFEQEYTAQADEDKRWVPPTSDEEGDLQGEIVVQFPNGWVWWDLGTNYDKDEAEAMGHCATCGENATLVSLREPRDNKDGTRSWRPHLTFELDEDGSLRQMKGVSNSKPKPEYHSYILALLTATKQVSSKSKKTEPIVKSIKGSSYKREADFALKDLTPEDLETLYAARPDLMPIDIYVQKHGVTRDLMVRVEGELKGVGYKSKWNGSKKSPLFEIEAWENLGDLIGDKGNDLAQWAWKITNGEEFLDSSNYSNIDTTAKELWDNLPDEMKENVKQILDHKYPQEFKKFLADAQAEAATRRGRIPRENVIDFAEERDEEDLLQAIRNAAQVGEETGTQNEIFKSLKKALEDSAFVPKDPENYYDGPWAENLTLSEAADLINDTGQNSRMDGGDGDLDHRIVMKEPNYGFADFDEKAAVESFSSEYGIEKKLKEIEPAKVASTKIIEDYETPRLKVQVTGSPQRLFFEGTLKPEAHDWLTKVNFTDKVVVNFTVDLGADGEAYLNRLDSDIRYRGFGPELMKSALGKIAEMGYKHAKTYIENDNYASQAMVKKLGGTEVPDSYNGQGSYYELDLEGFHKEASVKDILKGLGVVLLSGALGTALMSKHTIPANPEDKALNQVGHDMMKRLPKSILNRVGDINTITFKEGIPEGSSNENEICEIEPGTRVIYVNPKYVDQFLNTELSDQWTAHETVHVMQSEIDPHNNRFPKNNDADPYGKMKDPNTIVQNLTDLRSKGDRMWNHPREEQAAIVQQYEALVDMEGNTRNSTQKKEIHEKLKIFEEYIADYDQLKVGSSPSETGQRYMALSGDKIVEEATIGEYELMVVKSGMIPNVYQVGLQRIGMDAFDPMQQLTKTPNSRGKGSLAEVKKVLNQWLQKYGELVIASHNPDKTPLYVAMVKRLGFKVDNLNLMGWRIPCISKTAAVDDDDETLAELDKLYPKLLGDTCGSLKVRGTIPNLSSIESSLGEDYIELSGIRVVQLQSSKQLQQGPQQPGTLSYSSSEDRRIRRLAEEINESREINPLIVVIEGKDLEEDLYILEGGHRFDALRLLGIKEFPAVVVLEK